MIKDINLFLILIPILFSKIWEVRTWFGELVWPSPLGGFEHNFLVKLNCFTLTKNIFRGIKYDKKFPYTIFGCYNTNHTLTFQIRDHGESWNPLDS